jgi:hypothetical protein
MNIERERERDKDGDRDRERQRETEIERQRESQRRRDRESEREEGSFATKKPFFKSRHLSQYFTKVLFYPHSPFLSLSLKYHVCFYIGSI